MWEQNSTNYIFSEREMVWALQSLVVRLSLQRIQSENSKTGRSPRYGKKRKKRPVFFEQRTTIFVLFSVVFLILLIFISWDTMKPVRYLTLGKQLSQCVQDFLPKSHTLAKGMGRCKTFYQRRQELNQGNRISPCMMDLRMQTEISTLDMPWTNFQKILLFVLSLCGEDFTHLIFLVGILMVVPIEQVLAKQGVKRKWTWLSTWETLPRVCSFSGR